MCGRFTQPFTREELYHLYNLNNTVAPNIQLGWAGVIVAEEGSRIYNTNRWKS